MRNLLLIMFTLIFINQLIAQSADEAIELLENEGGIGARAAAMGNAYTGVADDYSAIYFNPAGLAQLRQGQVWGDLYNLNFDNSARYYGSDLSDNRTFTKLQSIGIAYPFPVLRGSLVFAFGYQRIKDLDSFLNFSGYDGNSNGLYFDYGDQIGDVYFDSGVQRTQTVYNDGNLSQWSFAAAMDLSPNFSAGLTINFYGGSSTYTSDYLQEDIDNIYRFDTNPIDFDYYLYQQKIVSDYSGLELKLGGLFRLSEQVRLGATITFPMTLTVTESWSENDEIGYDDLSYEALDLGSGEFDYDIKVPFKFGAGISFQQRYFLLSASMDYRDWSQVEYAVPSDRSASDYRDLLDENAVIRDDYRAVLSYSLGGEFNVMDSGMFLRAGYRRVPTPLKDGDGSFDKVYYSGGIGYKIDKSTTIDVSYTRGTWENQSAYLYTSTALTTEDITTTKVLVGLKFSF